MATPAGWELPATFCRSNDNITSMTTVDRTPAYRDLDPETLHERADALFDRYQACDCCPHQCGVDRTAGEIGLSRLQVDDRLL